MTRARSTSRRRATSPGATTGTPQWIGLRAGAGLSVADEEDEACDCPFRGSVSLPLPLLPCMVDPGLRDSSAGGTHSPGRTARWTRTSGGGRAARRRWSRMATRDRASLRETTVRGERKMWRARRSASEARRLGLRPTRIVCRARRRRRRCSVGNRARLRRWWDVCSWWLD